MRKSSAATMRVTRLVVPLILASTVSVAAQTVPAPSPGPPHRSLLHVLTYAAGGMLVGGWAGYVTAQVVRSDWTDTTGRGTQRRRFTLGGAAFGLVTGIFLGTRGRRAVVPPRPRLPLPINRPVTNEEIRSSNARTISELLRELRPQWLRQRGIETINPNSSMHAARGVVVYLNGTLLGGLETLDEISIDAITGIRFLNGPAAVLRYGTGNEDGAILLTTAAGP